MVHQAKLSRTNKMKEKVMQGILGDGDSCVRSDLVESFRRQYRGVRHHLRQYIQRLYWLFAAICLVAPVDVAIGDDVDWRYRADAWGNEMGSWIYVNPKTDALTQRWCAVPEGEVTIPSTIGTLPVYGIDSRAFEGCTNMTSVIMPNSIVSMGSGAFEHCYKLESVSFSANLTNISDGAFWSCISLKNIIIPSRVRYVGKDAFGHCRNLTHVTIPPSVTAVGWTAFEGCTNLVAVNISDLSAWFRIKFDPVYGDYVNSNPLSYARELRLNGEFIEDLEIPANIRQIRSGTFYNYCGLKTVTIHSGITEIGKGAFQGSGITNVIFASGGSALNIGGYAFSYCAGLKNITIPNNVTNIENFAFYGCTKLTNVVMGSGVKRIGNNCFQDGKFKDFTIGANVEKIGSNAFDDCSELETIIFPCSVTNIGSHIFSACFKLSAIYLPTNYTGNTSNTIGSMFESKIIRYVPEQRLALDAHGGSVAQASLIVSFNSAYGALPEPVRDGYVFDGWFYNGERITAQSIVRAINDHELTAAWKPIKYAVAFDANGGTGDMDSIWLDYDSTTNLPPCTFRNSGQVFAGWATNAVGSGTIYGDGAVVSNLVVSTNTAQTLYAMWEPLVVSPPHLSSPSGAEFGTDTCLASLECDTAGAVIYYSTNGVTPRLTQANAYQGPIPLTDTTTIKAIAFLDGVRSEVCTFTVTKVPPALPTITPLDGSVFVGDECEVTISCTTPGVAIYYSTDGTTPVRSEANRYRGPFTVTRTTTIIAFAANDKLASECVSATLSKWDLTLADGAGAPALTFTTSDDAPWTPISDVTSANGYAAKSGAIGLSSATWMETSVRGAGIFAFNWRVDCEHDYSGECMWDCLSVYTNGVLCARIDGTTEWATVSLQFDDNSAVTHVRWEFYKDDYDEDGADYADCAWVGCVNWSPSGTPPIDPIPVLLDIDVPSGTATNVTEVIGTQYGALNKLGGGVLTLSAANEFIGSVTNSGGGLIVADIGRGIPSSAGMVFLSGTYAPLTATSLTVPLGTGPGKFDMSLDHLKIAALNAPLTVNFGGSAEPIVSGGPMNPNAKAFHFGWKDDNGEYPITVLNPLVISSPLTLRSQRNEPVTLAGGVRAASGVTGKSLDMPDGWQSQFRFTETGPLYIPGNKWNPQGGGTTTFDGGRHEVGEIYGSRHNIVFTNGAHFVSSVCYFGRDNADNVVNIYAYDSVISNASGNVRLGCTSKAKGNWYMSGGELAFADVSGTPSFAIGDMGQGAFYQESGDVKLRNSAMYIGFNSAYSGLYKIDGGTFSTEKTMNVGYYGTGTVVVAGGNLDVGNTFVLGQETTAYGRMRMSDGIVAYNHNAMIGRYGRGYLLMTGGQLKQKTDMESSLGRFVSGGGRLDITGGEYSSCYSGTSYGRYIGWEGTGVVSVASAGLFSFSNTVYLGKAAMAYGEIDLCEGGVFETKILSMGDGYQKIVADGGTFRICGNGATVNFFNNAANLDESYVGRRGVTFDTRNNTASIGNFALDGRSPGAIRKTGSGTLVFTGLPQTGGGIEVNDGTVLLASGATVGAAFSVPTTDDAGGNSYPASPSDSLVAQNYLLHRWSFNNGSVVDSVAGNVATVNDDNVAEANIAFKDGCVSLSGGTTKGVRYIDLGSGLFGDEDGEFTIEFWARVPNWTSDSKLFSVGNSATEEIFMNVAGIVCARGVSGEQSVSAWNSTTVPNGTMCHFAVIIGKANNGKRDVRFLLKDATTGATLGENVCANRMYSPILHQDIFAFGYSYHDEADAKIDIDEVRIWKAALSDAQLSANAVRGPDDVPLLNMDGGAGPVQIASGAVFDLGGNTITYPGVAGAGTVRNGAITVDSLNVTGSMRLDADVTVTGEIVFAEGASLVTAGSLNIAGATVRYVASISVPSLVLISTESGGRIAGVPATVDLGNNSQYKHSVDASVLKLEFQADPLPEIAADSDVGNALMGAGDNSLRVHLTSKAQYDLFRAWVDSKGLEHQAVKDSPRAWFSYAIGATGLVEQAFQNDDLTICSLSVAANGVFSFEVEVKGVPLDTVATSEKLATVFEVQGASSLNANSFSSDKVTTLLGVSANGRLSVIATPKVAYEKFFVRVRMHADDDGWMVDTHRKVQLWEDGPYWAETNIGAEEPWEYGFYFWWGDVVGHKYEGGAWVSSDGTMSNFSFDSSNTPTYGKSISTLQNEGWITADGILAPEHDAAHVHWGGGWRMPTDQELSDLVSKCDWTWITMNGVQGYVIRGKDDYASVSIFLPAAGLGFGDSFSNTASHGSYWSSVPKSDAYNAWRVYFSSDYNYTSDCSRFRGQPVRAVQGNSE